jgi:fatty acid/phospholipid biosynthesis enzyme
VRTRIRKTDNRSEEMKSKDKGSLFRSFETVKRGTADTSVLAREIHQ